MTWSVLFTALRVTMARPEVRRIATVMCNQKATHFVSDDTYAFSILTLGRVLRAALA